MRLEEVQFILEPYHPLLIECVHSAWNGLMDVIRNGAEYTQHFSSKTKASCMQDLMRKEIQKRFSGNPDIQILNQKDGLFLLAIQDLCSLRPKKLDKFGRTRNIQTYQQKNVFGDQLELPGIPSGIRVSLGYQLDGTETSVTDVQIVYEERGELIWSYPILGEQPSIEILPLPFPQTEPAPKRVKAKKDERAVKSVNE